MQNPISDNLSKLPSTSFLCHFWNFPASGWVPRIPGIYPIMGGINWLIAQNVLANCEFLKGKDYV